MEPQLQRFEIEPALLGDHDFAVEHARCGSSARSGSTSSGK